MNTDIGVSFGKGKLCLIAEYCISSVIRNSVFFHSKTLPKNRDLDHWVFLGRVKLVLLQNFIGLI